ncbi:hypothetical protein [Clostridioides difficile]|nr:hypothetical protein [Clostridioides difficile]
MEKKIHSEEVKYKRKRKKKVEKKEQKIVGEINLVKERERK